MNMHYQDLSCGITTIDTGFVRPGFTASHLLVEDGQAAFIDIGPTSKLPALLEVLARKRIPYDHVRYVMVTHVHLDHAGGAGKLLQELPNAQLVVHPKGARHMVNPDRLIAGATAVYGEEAMRTQFGEILPVPRERVIEPADNTTLALGERQLLIRHTAGHARHHYCVIDERSQGIFTGDAFGVSYREFGVARDSLLIPATAPTQFEPEEMHASIDRLMAYRPRCLYLTHFGKVTEVPRLAENLHQWIEQFVALTRNVDVRDEEDHRQVLKRRITQLVVDQLIAYGCDGAQEHHREFLEADIELNVMGLEVWLARCEKRQQQSQ